MSPIDDEVLQLAKKLGLTEPCAANDGKIATSYVDKLKVVESIASSIKKSKSLIFACVACSKKFRIPRADETKEYRCYMCGGKMSCVHLDESEALGTELILDEAIPADVREAIRTANNVFGRFVLLEKIGEGGMGEVFRAFDAELGRYVAFKFIKSDIKHRFTQKVSGSDASPSDKTIPVETDWKSGELEQELAAESRTLAGLEHPNIARIYDIGVFNVRGFIAMQLIHGKPVERWHDIISACEAVDYAHKRGVIHRDIKPANIMVDKDCNVFVMDFGLAVHGAKICDIAGTPGYIAPEIASGGAASVYSDVYSLAATIYFLIEGNPPVAFTSMDTEAEILAKIRENKVVPMSKAQPELEAIVMKGLATDAGSRYSSAAQLSQDLGNFSNGMPVAAYGSGVRYRFEKAVGRHKFAAASACMLVLIVIAAGLFALSNYRQSLESQARFLEALENEKRAKSQVELLMVSMLDDLSKAHEEALVRRHSGEKYSELAAIPKRILQSAVYRESIDIAMKNAQVRYSFGKLYRIIGDSGKAAAELEAAIALDPAIGAACFDLGAIHFFAYKRAIDRLREDWRRKMSEKLFHNGGELPAEPADKDVADDAAKSSGSAAQSMLSRALKLIPASNPVHQIAQGMLHYSQEKYDIAASCLAVALKSDLANEDAAFLLAYLHTTNGRLSEAAKTLTTAIEIDKGNYYLLQKRGRLNLQIAILEGHSGRNPDAYFGGAVDDLNRALSLKPDQMESMIELGGTLLSLSLYDRETGRPAGEHISKSLEAFSRAVESATGSDLVAALAGRGAAWTLYADTLTDCGKDPIPSFNSAIADLSRSLELMPEKYESWMRRAVARLGIGYFKMGKGADPTRDIDDAMSDIDEAIKRNAADGSLYVNRSRIRFARGSYFMNSGKDGMPEFESALKDADEALSRDQRFIDAYLTQASVYANIGFHRMTAGEDPTEYYSRSERSFLESIERNSKYFGSWMRKGNMHNAWGLYMERCGKSPEKEYDTALFDLTEAIRLNAINYEPWLRRGTLRYNIGLYKQNHGQDPEPDYDAGLEDFAECMRINESTSEVWLRRGNLWNGWGLFLLSKDDDPMEKFKSGLSDFTKALEANPRNSEALLTRGGIHVNMAIYRLRNGLDPENDYVCAERDLNEAIAVNPRAAMAWLFRSNLNNSRAHNMEHLGDPETAARFLDASADDLERCVDINRAQKAHYQDHIRALRSKAKELRGEKDY